jgi:hypothetical protein
MENVKAKQVRLWIGLCFALFLMVSACLCTLAVIGGFNSDAWVPMPPDTAPAIRLLLFVIGLVFSWVIGSMCYRGLIKGEIGVADSVNIAYGLALYLLLIIAAIFFLGVIYWFLLPFMFLILVVFSVLSIWRLLGGVYSFGALAAAAITSVVTLYLFG